MELIWQWAERLDRLAMKTLERVDQASGRGSFRKRAEEATREVRAPQRVIQFEK